MLKKYKKLMKNAIEVNAIPTGCSFWHKDFEDGTILISPMKSGKKGLFRFGVYTPHDPGDQHFYSYEFLCYLD